MRADERWREPDAMSVRSGGATVYSLVLNAGSSSLKFCVFASDTPGDWRAEARGQIDGIGSSPAFSAKDGAGQKLDSPPIGDSINSAGDALDYLASWLRERFGGVPITGVGHRVVHGGSHYSEPVLVTPQVMSDLRELIPLAPLHQPYNLAAIDAVSERLPHVKQVACFDTGFHALQPAMAKLVPLPKDICGDDVKRYGFHGLSYEYIVSVLPVVAPRIADGRVIVAHLGSGASLCALRGGKSIENTFGFTPLDGLCMGTRPGALDPGIVLYLFQHLKLSVKEVETILYKQSGLLGISGKSNDMRDLLGSSDPRATLALEYFVYRAAREIGGLASVLQGVDALVFTAGIGENSAEIRRRICEASAWLGLELDAGANAAGGPCISHSGSKVAVWVIPTNEELMIARHMDTVLGLANART
jgi:acetate kinase